MLDGFVGGHWDGIVLAISRTPATKALICIVGQYRRLIMMISVFGCGRASSNILTLRISGLADGNHHLRLHISTRYNLRPFAKLAAALP